MPDPQIQQNQKDPQVPVQYEADSDFRFKKKVSFPYTTVQPSGMPAARTEIIYYDGTNYWFYSYQNAGWRSTKLNGVGFPDSPAQGDIIYYNGTSWVVLNAGTSGYYLKTQGTGANPTWAAVSQPTTLPPQLAAEGHTQVDVLSVLNTDVTYRSFSIPAMGANDTLVIKLHVKVPDTGSYKFMVGATTIVSVSPIANTDRYYTLTLYNRNSVSAQYYTLHEETGGGYASVGTSAINLGSAFSLLAVFNDTAVSNGHIISEYGDAILYKA